MAQEAPLTPVQEWRRNWPVVLAGAAGGSLATVHLYSTGVMIEPLEREFGWTRAQISSGLTIVAVAGVIFSPIVGMIVDRIGARRVALAGASLFCLFVALLSQSTPSIWMWWAIWCGIAVTAVCIAPTVWAAGVSGLFTKSRGMALAVTLCGTSIGALVVPMATHTLIGEFAWRGAYLGLAAIWAAIVLPLVYFGFSSAVDRKRSVAPAAQSEAAAQPEPAPVMQTIMSWRFVKLAVAGISIVTVASSILANIVPILTSTGYDGAQAAAIAGLIGAGSLIGRFCGGYLLDRIDGRFVAAVCVLMPIATSLILLWMPGSTAAVSIGVFILGLAVGIEWDAVAYLTSRHFGVARFGTVFGTIGGLSLLMNGMGPFLTNYAYDVTGAYDLAIWAFIPLCLISSVMFLSLGRYPDLPEGS